MQKEWVCAELVPGLVSIGRRLDNQRVAFCWLHLTTEAAAIMIVEAVSGRITEQMLAEMAWMERLVPKKEKL